MLICVNFAWSIEVTVYLKPLRHAMFRCMQMIVWSKPHRSMGLLDECLIWAASDDGPKLLDFNGLGDR